ncbi:hypothetical protein GCM10018790_78110 [Kitasatospora xanthocidica]|nr:hypothetical protein [Kitasatospora xanthocidica]GHF89104.1 hypothetical protein GCM10018790_78110 [Kitasatospora xanthocidica]
MRTTTPRRIARLLAVYTGAALRILLLGGPQDPDVARAAGLAQR